MTIKLPPENILDKILKLFGKKRSIIIPNEFHKTKESIGQYVTIKAKRESFWKVLFRR